ALSLPRVPRSVPASAASVAVFVRLPLWPRANDTSPTLRYTGWALLHVLEPVVEYRVWPMARWWPWSGASWRSSNTFVTRPMSLTTKMWSPSLTAIPADSWPRCLRSVAEGGAYGAVRGHRRQRVGGHVPIIAQRASLTCHR